MTVGEALASARRCFRDVRGDSARTDAALLLGAALGRDAAWLLAHDRDSLEPDASATFEAAVRRRERGEPVAYILGSAGFCGRTFVVTPDVLVPRPETEQLVELALAHLRAAGRAAPAICDVGTGSGILAITLACELPNAQCTAIDLSAPTLDVAHRNAVALGVAARVGMLRGDLLDAVPASARYDCVVANLPYVATADIAASPDPTSFEPRVALDGGADGLAAYRRLCTQLGAHMQPGGAAFLEAGPDTAPALRRLTAQTFPTAAVTLHADYAALPRIVSVVFR